MVPSSATLLPATRAEQDGESSARSDLLVFGAQGADCNEQLKLLLQRAKEDNSVRGSTCRAFLHAAHSAIVEEASAMSPDMWARFPPLAKIKTLSALIDHFTTSRHRDAAIEGAVLCLYQIASALLAPSFLSRIKIVTGLCSGTLAAAAVAVSENPLQLAGCGVEMVRLAFWIGVESSWEAHKWARDRFSDSWTLACHGRDVSESAVQQLLKRFNERLSASGTCQRFAPLYISTVVSETNFTVSGPPALLDLFQKTLPALLQPASTQEDEQSAKVPRVQCARIAICSPYHSNQLLGHAVERVLLKVQERDIAPQLRRQPQTISLLLPFQDDSKFDLTATLVHGVLTQVNRWDAVARAVQQLERLEGRILFCDKAARGLANHLGSPGRQAPLWDLSEAVSTPANNPAANTKDVEDEEQIAVVSLSCRFPDGADTPDKFWSKLAAQDDCCKEIPPHLFDWKAYRQEEGRYQRNTMSVPYGNFLDSVDKFDNQLFSMSPKESIQLDPQHRLALMCCYEAMEDAGFVPEQMSSYLTTRVGCFIGASSDDYRENASSGIGAYFITGNIRAFIPGHVSFSWNLEGPSNSIDTACSSSLVAIESACDALLNKQCDAALAGGVTILTQPQMFMGYERAGMLSPSGQNRTFDDNVNGICRGDGVGIVMLKRLSTAVAEGDNILGVIRGCQSNFSSLDDKTRLAAPSQQTLENLFRKSCKLAKVNPLDVSYIDAHGAGQKQAEAAEVNAISKVFGSPTRSRPLYIGSPKPTFGYSEAACGMAAVVKVLQMFKKRALPGLRQNSPNFRLNASFNDLQSLNVEIPLETVELSQTDLLLAGISNTNFLGGNSFLIMEEYTGSLPRTGVDPRTHYVVTISAKSRNAAESTKTAYSSEISMGNQVSIGDISYTSTARRQHFGHRVVATGSDWASIAQALKVAPIHSITDTNALVGLVMEQKHSEEMRRGFQHLHDTNRTFRIAFEEALTASKHAGMNESSESFAFTVAFAVVWTKWLSIDVVATDLPSLATSLVVNGALDVYTAARFAVMQRSTPLEHIASGLQYHSLKITTLLCNGDSVMLLPVGSTINPEALSQFFAAKADHPVTSPSHAISARAQELGIPGTRCYSLHIGEGSEAHGHQSLTFGPDIWKNITEGLAALYAGGIDPDWKAYHADYAGNVRLAKLPNYQFDLQSYWMEYQDRGLLPSPVSSVEEEEDESEALPERGTPTPFALLGQRWPEQDDRVTTFSIDVASNSLLIGAAKGHKRNGKAILPASVFCEQAVEAITHLLKRSDGDDDYILQTSHLQLLRPYTLEDKPQPLHLRVEHVSEQAVDCSWSEIPDGSSPLAKCRAFLGRGRGSETSLERAVASQMQQVRDVGNVLPNVLAYRLLTKATTYSEQYQSVREICFSKDEAVATIAASTPHAPGLLAHLSVLEALLQVTSLLPNINLLDNSDADAFAADEIGMLSLMPGFFEGSDPDLDAPMTVYAVAAHDARSKHEVKVDSYAFKGDKIVATMLGVKYRRSTDQTPVTSTPKKFGENQPGGNREPKALTTAAAAAPSAPAPQREVKEEPVAEPKGRTSSPPATTSALASVTMLRQVLIDELGISEADLTPDQNLADLGLDSLMSLQVLGVMQEKVNMELPSSLFMDYPTFRKVDEFLQRLGAPFIDSQVSQPTQPSQPPRPTASADSQARQVAASLSKSTKDDQASVQVIMEEVGTTKPVLVSGRSFVGKQAPLYLLPDGSGTGAVYMETASLGRPVYAVTSPHLAKNKHANWSVEEIAAKYLECIATIHPGNQELFLGGWSFGGIVAFEACRLLQSRGSIPVLGVLLIDCPDPAWPPLPVTVLDWVYGPNGNPELKKQAPPGFSPTMRSHFDSTLAALTRYKPAPLKTGPPFIVANGLNGLGGSPDDVVGYNTAVGWLQKDRQNLGLHGWDRYLPEHSATVVEVEGNHFTVCKRNATEALATALQSLWSHS